MDQALEFIDTNLEHAIEELVEFVRIPSISAGANKNGSAEIERAADYLVNKFTKLEFTAETKISK